MDTAVRFNIEKRQTLVESIAQETIRYIAANRLRGGDQLPSEREFMEMAGVSRLPLREALCMLKGLGIVEARQGKGIFVKNIDISALFAMLSPLLKTQADVQMGHIAQVRYHMEAEIAELAAAHRTEADLVALRAALEGMRTHRSDFRGFTRHDMAFHQELASATGNPIFHVFMASITDLLYEFQLMYPDKVEYREASIEAHAQILQAIEERDTARAREAMRQHIAVAEKRIDERMRAHEKAQKEKANSAA